MNKVKNENINIPLSIVVFGATGDLYQNKLAVALFNLFNKNLLPKDFQVFGFGRRAWSESEFQDFTREAILKKVGEGEAPKNLEDFLGNVKYFEGDLSSLESFKSLGQVLEREDAKRGECSNKLFYLSVPPNLYEGIFKNIHKVGLTVPCSSLSKKQKSWTRVLVEKPFGQNIKHAEKLDLMLGKLFDESQIFRIDHYLAKETMRNLLDFSFSNGLMKSLWNNKNIEYIKIALHENNTLKDRASFYEGVGALRDVGQNHVLQILALVAMEDPKKTSGDIHKARNDVFEKTSLFSRDIVRAQYRGYLEEKNVNPLSDTETFFRVKLGIDNKRWKGVPFILESGKALGDKQVFIEVCFKETKACFKFFVASPEHPLDDAYEKVFYDCILGDQTVFVSTKEVMSEWRIVTDILKKWQKVPLVVYEKGSSAEEIH